MDSDWYGMHFSRPQEGMSSKLTMSLGLGTERWNKGEVMSRYWSVASLMQRIRDGKRRSNTRCL